MIIPEAGSPALLSWKGGFTLCRLTEVTPHRHLFELRHYPRGQDGYRWAVRCLRIQAAAIRQELCWLLSLPVLTETAARMIFGEVHELLQLERVDRPGRLIREISPANLTESQLRYLPKTYPRSMRLFRAVENTNDQTRCDQIRQQLAQAYPPVVAKGLPEAGRHDAVRAARGTAGPARCRVRGVSRWRSFSAAQA